MKPRLPNLLAIALPFMMLCSCILPLRPAGETVGKSDVQATNRGTPLPDAKSGATALDRAIEVVQSRSGVYVYTYAETMEELDPKKDFIAKYRVFDDALISRLRRTISENRDYSPEFKARCLPMWEYGLEFRDQKTSVTFLFSFRCNTIRYIEGNLFKDFTPQRNVFYQFFTYEIRPETASLLEKK